MTAAPGQAAPAAIPAGRVRRTAADLFPPEGGGAAIVERVALARARLGWPPAREFEPSALSLADVERIAETATFLAGLLRSPGRLPPQLLADLSREMGARALRLCQIAAMCGGRP